MHSKQNRFSWRTRMKSFAYAGQGLKALFKTEHNAWIHLGLTLLAFAAAFVLKISRVEAIALIVVMTLVWTAELFNTALEKTADFITLQKHPQIKLIKDIAAAAVLLTALAALATGALIFVPKLLAYVQDVERKCFFATGLFPQKRDRKNTEAVLRIQPFVSFRPDFVQRQFVFGFPGVVSVSGLVAVRRFAVRFAKAYAQKVDVCVAFRCLAAVPAQFVLYSYRPVSLAHGGPDAVVVCPGAYSFLCLERIVDGRLVYPANGKNNCPAICREYGSFLCVPYHVVKRLWHLHRPVFTLQQLGRSYQPVSTANRCNIPVCASFPQPI